MTKGALFSVTAEVTLADGSTRRVSTNSWDIIVVERALGQIEMLKSGAPSIEETFRLIHSAAQRAGFAGDDFDAWVQEVNIDIVDDDTLDPKAGSDGRPISPLS